MSIKWHLDFRICIRFKKNPRARLPILSDFQSQRAGRSLKPPENLSLLLTSNKPRASDWIKLPLCRHHEKSKKSVDVKLNLVKITNTVIFIRGRTCGPRHVSAPSVGGWVFGFQALFEAAEQNAVAFVLLVLPGVELPLDLEAPVHHERRAQHREPVSGHVELAGLRGDKKTLVGSDEGGGGRTD